MAILILRYILFAVLASSVIMLRLRKFFITYLGSRSLTFFPRLYSSRSSQQRCSMRKGFLRKHLCSSIRPATFLR